MINKTDYMCWLVRDYDYNWDPSSGRLISVGIPGHVPNRELGHYKSSTDVYDRLAPLLSNTDFTERYLKFVNN